MKFLRVGWGAGGWSWWIPGSHWHRGAVVEWRARGGEEQVGVGDAGDLGPAVVIGARYRGPVSRGVDDRGHDAVDGNPGAGNLLGRHPREVQHAELAHRIGEAGATAGGCGPARRKLDPPGTNGVPL